LDTASRSVVSWQVGKRNWQNTRAIVEDVRRRVVGNPTICSDAFVHYQKAVDYVFQGEASHGLVDKQEVIVAKDADSDGKYYARQKLVRVERTAFSGNPEFITTSHIERANLTVRMGQRRFTRKTNGHSKKFQNHVAALSLFNAHYNLCKIHETLRMTPAMALGITQHIWGIGELVTATLTGEVQDQVGIIRKGFRVIHGGRHD
jgi:IS1 family transposase